MVTFEPPQAAKFWYPDVIVSPDGSLYGVEPSNRWDADPVPVPISASFNFELEIGTLGCISYPI